MSRLPDIPSLRIIVAIVILTAWLSFHVIDTIAGTHATTPVVDAMCGAVVTWLFGAPLLRKPNDD